MLRDAAARVALLLIGPAALVLAAPQLAAAQESYPATVTRVVEGDIVDAQLATGPVLRVRLIGIDAPDPGDCGAASASAYLEQLVLGRAVTLVTDPSAGTVDDSGHSLYYVDRDDALDAGLEMLRSGWARVFGGGFQRVGQYRAAEREAAGLEAGVWDRCAGDFHHSRAEELRERRSSAVSFMRRYYRRVTNRQFAAAWGMLARPVRRDVGPFRAWRRGHRGSLGASVRSARARLSGRRAVVSIRLTGRRGRLQRAGGAPDLPRSLAAGASGRHLGRRSRPYAEDGRRARARVEVGVPAAGAAARAAIGRAGSAGRLPGLRPVHPARPGCRLRRRLGERAALRARPGDGHRRRSVRPGLRRRRRGLRVLRRFTP
jgi:endonuclease YncB( thermonuclease family)